MQTIGLYILFEFQEFLAGLGKLRGADLAGDGVETRQA